MSNVRNFGFGARTHGRKPKADKPRVDIPFTLEDDGPVYQMRAVDPERASIIALAFSHAQDGGGDAAEEAALTNEMLDMLFTPDTVKALLRHLRDPEHFFDWDMFTELIQAAVAEHSGGRPTESSRTSSASRRATGPKSTARSSSKASTSGRSRSTAR